MNKSIFEPTRRDLNGRSIGVTPGHIIIKLPFIGRLREIGKSSIIITNTHIFEGGYQG
jgi:hypothetical protein